MSDSPNGKNHNNKSDEDERPPEFVSSRRGRMVSVYGLVERIIEQFELEHGEGESNAIKETTSDVERRKLVRDVADYIFGVESVQLSPHEQARLIAMANAEIFGFGPLDELFKDERITTISLEGAQKVGVRYGPAQDLTILDPIFDDTPHMQLIIKRMLFHSNAEFRSNNSIIETGLVIDNRRISLSVAFPPFVPEIAVDIRLHPVQLPTFEEWLDQNILNKKTLSLLNAIMQSEHGLLVVGDTESGKTTLLSMLLQTISGEGLVSVERASELFLPDGAESLATQWAFNEKPEITFGEQIVFALEHQPKLIVLDEVRADEPHAVAPLLKEDHIPRQIWSFRGTSEPKRLTSALGMLARMADSTQPEHMVLNLYKRLPFVVIIKRRKGKLQLREIAEWQFADTSNQSEDFIYADYVPLMTTEWDECEVTGQTPQHHLNLDEDFWQKE